MLEDLKRQVDSMIKDHPNNDEIRVILEMIKTLASHIESVDSRLSMQGASGHGYG